MAFPLSLPHAPGARNPRRRRDAATRLPLLLALLLTASFGAELEAQEVFWEDPNPISEGGGKFPQIAAGKERTAIFWQESAKKADGSGYIWISAKVWEREEKDWRTVRRFAGPYPFSSNEPPIYSVCMGPNDEIVIAVSAADNRMDILRSYDGAHTFSNGSEAVSNNTSVGPKIFARSDGGFILFVTQGDKESLNLFYSLSGDAITWSEFLPLVTESELQLNFLPSFSFLKGKEYVVFQSLLGGERPTFQLWIKMSEDAGRTWSEAKRVTNFNDPIFEGDSSPASFDNQRPFLKAIGGKLYLVWERRPITLNIQQQVYFVDLDESGNTGVFVELVSSKSGVCGEPQLFVKDDTPAVVWYDNRAAGNHIYYATKSGERWTAVDLSGVTGDSSFGRAVSIDGLLYAVWQNTKGGEDRVYLKEPDLRVSPIRIATENFSDGVRIRTDTAKLTWSQARDPSGIEGYSYLWGRDPQAEPPKKLSTSPNVKEFSVRAGEDGEWYFAIIAQDGAGNWSKTSRVNFIRDTTAPGKPEMVPPQIDDAGWLLSNTFSLEWAPAPEKDLAGYSYTLQYAGPPEDVFSGYGKSVTSKPELSFDEFIAARYGMPKPPPMILTVDTKTSYENSDNGVWIFSLTAIDTVGNISPPAYLVFRLDKYVPHTYITYADSGMDDFGKIRLRILGRGFSEGGLVDRLVIDRDGKAPYDRDLMLGEGRYRVNTDRLITGIEIEDMETGSYLIGLHHPTRGWYYTMPLLSFDSTGTVKFGDFAGTYVPSWKSITVKHYRISVYEIIAIVTVAFCGIGILLSVRKVSQTAVEGFLIRKQAIALITGEIMPHEKKKRAAARLKRRGIGLRIKFAFFVILLVILVVVMVSVPLGAYMIGTQSTTLALGLQNKAKVLLESLSSGARSYLPSQNLLELGYLPAQTQAMEEAVYTTITGYGPQTTDPDRVWATNDPDILAKTGAPELKYGSSKLNDSLSPSISAIVKELNEQATREVGSLNEAITQLNKEGTDLATKADPQSQARIAEISQTSGELEKQLSAKLATIANAAIDSVPKFDPTALSRDTTRYIFYKPVLFRQGTDNVYYRGMIRLEVSTKKILEDVDAAQTALINIVGIIALIAIGLGMVGALILASIVVNPIRKLVGAVEKIRDTEDKAQLEGEVIDVKSKDEIFTLADTINQMTEGLVKAAVASKDLTVGKETQKMFIPLERNAVGEKLTTGKDENAQVEFFGYYEGAKGVSGDYFDFEKLDDRHYAIIKCDVAGKGVPAAFIMIEVATLFLNYVKNWDFKRDGIHLEKVVYQINDLIEGRGFKGRFAAFTIAILDALSGELFVCNAGDNLMYVYEAAKRELIVKKLPSAPSAGTFPNFLVEMKSPYKQVVQVLRAGDILLLYTDGIEEAKRKFRNSGFEVMKCAEGEKEDDVHLNHSVGQDNEEMGSVRVESIINAVMNRKRYRLVKNHNPIADEVLSFDFTSCTGRVEEVIMALIGVEKIFRLIPDPQANENDLVQVDGKVDEFLKKHFEQYGMYCGRQKPNTLHPEYLYYTNIREDEQYDDLTILGIRKK